MGFIYKVTNNINGKVYVGQTYLPIEQRFKQHINDSKNSRKKNRPFCYAINKYGAKNFSISLLEEVVSEKMNEREQYWIKKLKSYIGFHDSNGYNATLGGDSKKHYNYYLISNSYNKTKSKTQTSKEFNCCIQTIERALKAYNVQTVSKYSGCKICCLNDEGEILKQYDSIRKVSEDIAKRSHKNLQTVRKRINKVIIHNPEQKAYGFYWKAV